MSQRKPAARRRKLHPEFPLFKHARGYWCRKVRGKHHYFGKVADDPEGTAALEQWLAQKDDLLAGRRPRAKAGEFTICDLVNAFLIARELSEKEGRITHRTFVELRKGACTRIVEAFGLTTPVASIGPTDFDRLRSTMADWSAPRRAVEIARIRSVFNFAFKQGYIDAPVRFGEFIPPGKSLLAKHRERVEDDRGLKLFEAAEIRSLLAHTRPAMRAMILVAINCGFGNHDIGTLRWKDVDLAGGWITHARPKTQKRRRNPLWPETVEALKLAGQKRPAPADEDYVDHVFLTRSGIPFVRQRGDTWQDEIGPVFYKVIERAEIARGRRSFYALRHTFETIGSAACDQVALDFLMGHADSSMAANYRQTIGDDRLRRVADHVRGWLFPVEKSE